MVLDLKRLGEYDSRFCRAKKTGGMKGNEIYTLFLSSNSPNVSINH